MSTTPGAAQSPSTSAAAAPVLSAQTPAVAPLDAPTSNIVTASPAMVASDSTAPATAAGESSSPAAGGPAAAAAAAVPADTKQQTSSSLASDEKAAAASSPSPAAPRTAPSTAPGSKKRRKRGGLTGLFIALGCMTSDEFDDEPPVNKTTSAKPVAQNTVATGTPAAISSNGADPKTAAAKTAAVVVPTTAATPNVVATNNGTDALTTPARPDPDTDTMAFTPTEPTTPPLEETAGLTSGAVQAPGSGADILHQHQLHRTESEAHLAAQHPQGGDVPKTDSSGGYTDLTDTDGNDEHAQQEMLYTDEEYEDEEDRLIAQGGCGIPCDENGNPCPLLPPLSNIDTGRKCLVLDLDETLLHSSFKMLPSADYIVPVEIESQTHNVYVIKRPGVDHFLQEMGKIYEVVVFTASLSKYADPVLDMLDVHRVVRHRLFRESCYHHKGNYVKDLSQLGRDISTSIIIDNSPASYIFHPNNAVPVSTWFNDPHDTELTDLCPFLTDLATVDDVRGVLDGGI